MMEPAPADLNVSRETFEDLRSFSILLSKWNPRINLIARSTLNHVWSRHIADSLQVVHLKTPEKNWIDLGSGGGFPGIVAAIVSKHLESPFQVTLIESDLRKGVFLKTVGRELQLPLQVETQRIEDAEPKNAEVLSARALAPLKQLLTFADRHLAKDGTALFSKGTTWQKEVEDAQQHWRFQFEAIKSETEPRAVILKIEGVSRV